MGSDITLSAGVRQNLLSLQQTASMMSTTQNRLATGKKVNTALDNPSNFFTASSLSDRAGDLNSLLDSIGQATKTLDAASNGISSLTKLVQSAKSNAQQARQATGQVENYSAVNSSANILSASNLNGTESVATYTGTATTELKASDIAITGRQMSETLGQATGGVFANDAAVVAALPGAGTNDGTVQIKMSASGGATRTFDVTLAGASISSKAQLLAAFNGTSDGSGTLAAAGVTASYDSGTNALKLTANNADVDFSISAIGAGASTGGALAALGLAGGAHDSTSLFDTITSNGGSTAQGKTMVIGYTNPDNSTGSSTITFGYNAGQVSTLADLDTQIRAAATASGGGFSANATTTTNAAGTTVTAQLNITKPAASKSSITVTGGAGVEASIDPGLPAGATVFKTTNSQKTLNDLDSTHLSSGGSLSISVNGKAYTVGLAATDRIDDVVSKLNSSSLSSKLTFSKDVAANGNENIKVDAQDASVSYTINANDTSAALKLTTTNAASTTKNSKSLLNMVNQAFGGSVTDTTAAQGKTLTVGVNGGTAQTITFGTEKGQVQTIDQLNTKLSELSGATASVTSAGALDIRVNSGTSATSLAIGGTAAAKLGLTVGTQEGTVTSTTANATRTNLQNDFNNVLDQIDALAKDASYNGINLLNGDDLKVTFNENGSSSLNIKGVKFDANNLGLTKLKGTQFQDNEQIDGVLSQIDSALSTLRSQGSKFGSNLQTVQTRQEFTTSMVNTLQTGSDALVLADTNLEGANMLALQTRQQLSTTALSMANQANQAVLRLF